MRWIVYLSGVSELLCDHLPERTPLCEEGTRATRDPLPGSSQLSSALKDNLELGTLLGGTAVLLCPEQRK